jgi:RNA polymerase sigma-70 factor (ECF subfamily)
MFYNGYEYQEIAKNLNIPIGTVKSRIFSARVKMKAIIGKRTAA